MLSLFPERPWRKLALGWASLARQHFVTGAHALRDPLFILPGHRRLAGGDVRLGIEGYLLDRVSLVERFINGVGSADDEARGINLVELDGGVELGFERSAVADSKQAYRHIDLPLGDGVEELSAKVAEIVIARIAVGNPGRARFIDGDDPAIAD